MAAVVYILDRASPSVGCAVIGAVALRDLARAVASRGVLLAGISGIGESARKERYATVGGHKEARMSGLYLKHGHLAYAKPPWITG